MNSSTALRRKETHGDKAVLRHSSGTTRFFLVCVGAVLVILGLSYEYDVPDFVYRNQRVLIRGMGADKNKMLQPEKGLKTTVGSASETPKPRTIQKEPILTDEIVTTELSLESLIRRLVYVFLTQKKPEDYFASVRKDATFQPLAAQSKNPNLQPRSGSTSTVAVNPSSVQAYYATGVLKSDSDRKW